MEQDFKLAKSLSSKYPREISKLLQYGTAGFREKAENLVHVMYRMGLLAALRSKLKKGLCVGLMVTASHNPECDNGVKLCDPDGSMIEPEWEEFAAKLVNEPDEGVSSCLQSIASCSGLDYKYKASVFIGRDTRSSSEALSNAAVAGIKALQGEVKDFGLVTTPQLHFVVCCRNHPSYGEPTLQGYYTKLSAAFSSLADQAPKERYVPEVYVDGANGIGSLKLRELQEYVKSLKFVIFNDGSNGVLNFECGADFVKISQCIPAGCPLSLGRRFASLDGDADRLVYFYAGVDGAFHLLDGDKIAALVARYLQPLLRTACLEVCVVQTAYANSSSTRYIQEELGIPAVCVPTGVKHLHHEASRHDVGIYFEANGHGTILFSENAKAKIKELASPENTSDSQRLAAKKLLCTIDVINESVGDGISDLLLTESILRDLDWDLETWDRLYQDLPNVQVKVTVPDRTALTTTDAERKCVTPSGLQAAIDARVAACPRARAFVRPSGTEDVVRVYAEATTQASAKELADDVAMLVKKFTGA